MRQQEITRLICDEARKGRRVVRLKGGDAGLFGRLAEETSALEELRIPFVVRPGVSALVAATTGTGLLLTRRGESRGFSVLTPRSAGVDAPQVLFMAVRVASQEASKMIVAGSDRSTPCAIVFDAAGPREAIWRGTLAQLAAGSAARLVELERSGLPGLVVVGHAAACSWPKLGVLAGRRVLVTASEAVQPSIRLAVEDFGGRPVSWPMIELRARPLPDICKGGYDAIVLTSPSAVRIFFENCVMDRRRLPMFFTCGAGTDAELRRWGVASDVMPEKDFSAAGLIASIRKMDLTGKKVLRLRSAKAGGAVAVALRDAGAKVDDIVLYDNIPVRHADGLPPFDNVHFASASAVEAFLAAYGAAALRGKGIYVMGEPTRSALPPRMRARAHMANPR
jgi:uroporphyrinogen III methyltransferase/synthase